MDLEKLLQDTIDLSREAGAFIRREGQHFELIHVEEKGVNDLVSYVDKTAEKMIVKRLRELLPEAGFITEEGTDQTVGEAYNWIIDPLDGTTNFIHGLPIFSVSIGLQKDGEIILGVVYEVNKSECFFAIKGGGAFCNETPIKVSASPGLASSLIATGFPHDMDYVDSYMDVLKVITRKSRGFRRLGSAAIDLCYVACGRVDGYFQHNLQPYDVAGGLIIVKEAGGMITDFKGGDDFLFGGEIVASNGTIHHDLVEVAKGIIPTSM